MNNVLDRKMPTVLALFLIMGTIIGTTFLVRTGVIYLGGAAPSDNPQNVRVTNVSDTSASITYTTDAKVLGTVSYGKDKESLQTILDERDQQSGTPQQYKVHSITLHNLSPKTPYVFSITSGATTYLNHDAYFSFQTGSTISTPPSSQAPITGKIVNPDGTIPTDALVYVTTDNGQVLSTLAKNTGLYIIPLNTFRKNDLQSFFSFQETTPLHILATNGTDTSEATVLVSGSSPIPLITLSQTYNFVQSPQPLASDSAEASIGFPAFSSSTTLEATPVIITPQKDQTFTDPQPRFSGKALPNEAVTIEIHSSDVITDTIKTDTLGNWTYRPSQQLSPGQHTLTIMTRDANGILKTIQQSFTVFAAGSQVTESATPSATPTTSVPTPTSKPTPTAKPSVTTSPTATATLAPTAEPTIKPTGTKITPRPTLPPTGSNTVVIAGTTGIVTTLIGIVLFLLSRGALL